MAPSDRGRTNAVTASAAAPRRENANDVSDQVDIGEFVFECASTAFPSLPRPLEATDDSDGSLLDSPSQHAPRPRLRKEKSHTNNFGSVELEEPLELGDGGGSWEGRPSRKRQQPAKYIQEDSQPRKANRRKKEVQVPTRTGGGGGSGGGGGGGAVGLPRKKSAIDKGVAGNGSYQVAGQNWHCPAGIYCMHGQDRGGARAQHTEHRSPNGHSSGSTVSFCDEMVAANKYLATAPMGRWVENSRSEPSEHSDDGYEHEVDFDSDDPDYQGQRHYVKPRRARKRAKDRQSKVAGSLRADDLPDTSRVIVSQPWMSAVPPFGVGAPADRKREMSKFQRRGNPAGSPPTTGKSAFRPFLTLRNRRSYLHVQMAWQIYYDSKVQAGLAATAPGTAHCHAAPTPIRVTATRSVYHRHLPDSAAVATTVTVANAATATAGTADRTVGPVLGQVSA